MAGTGKIVMIGAGNVATHLAYAFRDAGREISFVWSRTEKSAGRLALEVGARYSCSFDDIDKDAGLYVIAVKDDALKDVAGRLKVSNAIVVHTSGTAPLSVLESTAPHTGVFYPLQTFSLGREVDFSKVPLCIEANTPETGERLKELALTVSNDVRFIDSGKRKVLHLAAVFACNFPNYLYYIADEILKSNSLDFNILKPLIKETASKIMDIAPFDAQTGPAKRNDKGIMELHLRMLEGNPGFREIYKILSEGITNMKKE